MLIYNVTWKVFWENHSVVPKTFKYYYTDVVTVENQNNIFKN